MALRHKHWIRLLAATLCLLGGVGSRADDDAGQRVRYPPVLPGRALAFPRDQGSHPAFRTEWWYVTGRLALPDGRPLGFQITFFRSRPPVAWPNPSAFNPRQLLFAHAALADPARGRLLHDQRAARAGLGLAEALRGRTDVWIGRWSLRQHGDDYVAHVPAQGFDLDLRLRATQPILPEGERGFSRKGPDPLDASYYYSQPHLQVSGTLTRAGRTQPVRGEAWLDHEWSSRYLGRDAVGWDWTGINFKDGGAAMLFRIRDARGGTLWAGGSYRDARGALRVFRPDEVRFTPLAYWRSPRTGIRYPVRWRVDAPGLDLRLLPLLDDQELDSRGSTGAVYWEGAVDALGAGRVVGQGYLEMTGYGHRLRLQ